MGEVEDSEVETGVGEEGDWERIFWVSLSGVGMGEEARIGVFFASSSLLGECSGFGLDGFGVVDFNDRLFKAGTCCDKR